MKNISDILQFQQFNNLELIARQVVEGFITGLHRSPFHGFSVEFAEHRPYNKGEEVKNIDWKLYARSEKLFVKKFEEETNLRCQLIIDTSSSMLFPYNEGNLQNKLFFSVYCAAALIYLLRKQRDAVGLTLFSDKIEINTRSRLSSTHAKRLFDELQKLLSPDEKSLQKRTAMAQVIHEIADNIHRRSLVVLFTDMMDSQPSDELFSALQHLRYNKHEVILFHVTDLSREGNFEYTNRPYKFVDLETNEEVKVRPLDIKENYRNQMHYYNKLIELKCGQYNIDLVSVDVNANFSDVLLSFLIKRRKLF